MADRISDRYVIVEQIGVGGMGTVYRAHDATIDRDVALKWLPGHFSSDPTFVQRFRREARVIARLEHPHIVPIYDVGEYESRPYIIMRLLTGGTLRDHLQSGTYTLGELQRAVDQVADALKTAHAQGIVHRDIKPGNLLFDDHGSVFLSDFGIAKVIDAATQLTGSGFIGTPAYMSPEQFRGDTIDGRSDQYALAVVVYEALSGNLPFHGDTAQMMYKHLSVSPPPIDLADVPAAFNEVLQKALSKNAQDRYTTISQFAAALHQVTAESGAESAVLPLKGRTAAATVLAGTAVQPVAAKTVDNLAGEYRQGLQAMAAYDWAAAVAAFDRVLAADPNYGNAAEFREQAASLMNPLPASAVQPTSDAAMTAAATAAATMARTQQVQAPAAAVPRTAVAAPEKRTRAPLAIIGGAAVLLLLLFAAAAFFLLSRGGGEEPAVASGSGDDNGAVVLAGTEGDDGQNADAGASTAVSNSEAPAAASEATPTASPTETSSPTAEPTATATAPPPTETVVSAAAAVSSALPSATPEVAVPPAVRVTVSSAYVRQGPGTVYPQAGIVTEGQVLDVIARDNAGQWYNVELPNADLAWIAASVVEAADGAALDDVEVAATIPAAPTATRVPPTATRPPATPTVVVPPPSDGGGGSGGNNGGGSGGNNGGGSGGNDGGNDGGGSSPPPVYTAEPP